MGQRLRREVGEYEKPTPFEIVAIRRDKFETDKSYALVRETWNGIRVEMTMVYKLAGDHWNLVDHN